MNIRPIRSEADHAAALAEVERLMEADPADGTGAFDRMDILTTLVEAYEARVHAIGLPHPVEAIEVRMAEQGMTRRQLCAATGIAESKLSEVMSRKRPLSLNMIRTIGPVLGLPAETLVKPYPVEERQGADA